MKILVCLPEAERIFALIDEEPETDDGYVTLYAEPGQKLAFVGSTGAGKTTIIN